MRSAVAGVGSAAPELGLTSLQLFGLFFKAPVSLHSRLDEGERAGALVYYSCLTGQNGIL